MFKKLALILLWFFLVPLLLTTSAFLLRNNTAASEKTSASKPITIPEGVSIAENNHLEGQVLGVEINDMRPYLVENFLEGTPLENHSQAIVETSDKYGIDWRLIPAIAMKETGGGRNAPTGSFNAWGFENGRTEFISWESAIDRVGKTLKDKYVARGLVTPEQIMAVYAPPQLLTGGKWAKDVNFFFTQLESL